MRLHTLPIVLILLTLSINVYCALRPLGSIADHKRRRDDLSDDLFTTDNGDEASRSTISSGNDVALITDEDRLLQDGSSGENLNDLELFTTNPSENIAQGSPCGRSFAKRDGSDSDLILSETSDFCSNEAPLSPDVFEPNFDNYNELFQKVDPDEKTPTKTHLVGPPLAPILPYLMITPQYDCPPGKVRVCCVYMQKYTLRSPNECFYYAAFKCYWVWNFCCVGITQDGDGVDCDIRV